MALAIIAIANFTKADGGLQSNYNKGIDIMIALDVSKSMLAKDIQPNRLERAKQNIINLIDKLPNNKIGLVVFAGKAFVQMPLTADIAAAKMYVSTANTDMISTQGTVISDALQMCNTAFNTTEKKYKSIIIISDGEDHDENTINTAEKIADQGVIINTIGIGSATGATIEDDILNEQKKDNQGNIIVTKLNEKILQQIAAVGNGSYQLYTNGAAVNDNICKQLKAADKKNIFDASTIQYQYYFQWFIGLAIVLLLLEICISETKKNGLNKKAMATIVMLLPFVFGYAQKTNELLTNGNIFYKKQQYIKAIETYQQILKLQPANYTALHNAGNALYKNNQFNEANEMYTKAIESTHMPSQKAAAWFNKGVVLQNSNQLSPAIDAYKSALKINPTDDDARKNLQKALIDLIKQKQKQAEGKQPKKQQPKPNEQPNKQPNKSNPTPNKMTKKEAEEKLKALSEKEKNLQDKLHKKEAGSTANPDKDW
jgi:Ca-activated chloride channel family protein